ncbi:MAG: PEP/pyruvate-binding domain-containing protein [Gaiellaceae bacterium]
MKPVPLAEAQEESVYGGKAVQLGIAIRAGLPVPPGIALPCSFVDAVAGDDAPGAAELEKLCAELRRPLAARSSAVGEDSELASFAGQHLTCLNVRSLPHLVGAVRTIWESGRSPSALAYRERLGLPSVPRIGVVVQELVDPDCAGVLFSRNPLDGSDEIVIEASWGLGEAVVAGLVTPDRFRLSRDGAVLERTARVKDLAVRIAAGGGTHETEVPEALVHALCLDVSQLAQLHALALRCEQVFAGDHDLEWAFAAGKIYLLQRRAVTRIFA